MMNHVKCLWNSTIIMKFVCVVLNILSFSQEKIRVMSSALMEELIVWRGDHMVERRNVN